MVPFFTLEKLKADGSSKLKACHTHLTPFSVPKRNPPTEPPSRLNLIVYPKKKNLQLTMSGNLLN